MSPAEPLQAAAALAASLCGQAHRRQRGADGRGSTMDLQWMDAVGQTEGVPRDGLAPAPPFAMLGLRHQTGSESGAQ